MDWLLLAALGMIWAAFLLPGRRSPSPRVSVEDFERSMGLLARTEGKPGRWIMAPARGARFVGAQERARTRARVRRRRVFVFLLESIALSFLLGLAPPLRPVWFGTGVLTALLAMYVGLLLWLKQREPARASRVSGAPVAGSATESPGPRGPADEGRRRLRLRRGGVVLPESDLVHVVVRRASTVGVAGG